MSEIFFIRHGQACFGTDHYDRLSPIGDRQAHVLARHLDACDIRFDAVYSGRMQRQRDTAQALCAFRADKEPGCPPPVPMAAFDEYDAEALLVAHCRSRVPEHAPDAYLKKMRADKAAFQAFFAKTAALWCQGVLDGEPGVESWQNFSRRVMSGVRRIARHNGRGKRLAVFTSGGPIAAAAGAALELSGAKTLELSWQIMNASLTVLKYSGPRLALSVFNCTAHLRLVKDTALLTYR